MVLNLLAVLLFLWAGLSSMFSISSISRLQNYFQQYYNPSSPDSIQGITETTFYIVKIGSIFSLSLGVFLFVFVPAILGYYLIRRRKYKLCKFFSILTCIGFPIGTLLGIISFVILSNKSMKDHFGIF